MILLKGIRARERLAELERLDSAALSQEVPIAPIVSAAAALGLVHLRIHDSRGSGENLVVAGATASKPASDPSRTIQEPGLEGSRAERAWKDLDAVLHEHRWSVQEDSMVYDAQFLHDPLTPPLIAAYVSLLLTAIGTRESQVLQFRLAMYEICANVIEHGRVRLSPAEIAIHLSLTPGEVNGWIQDSCEHFDLSAQPAGSIRERAETRASRGYGIHMMHQLLQGIHHEFNSTGNRIHFRKRIAT